MRRRILTGSGTQFCVVVLAWEPNADLKRSGKSAFETERIMCEGNFDVKFFLRSAHKKSDEGRLRRDLSQADIGNWRISNPRFLNVTVTP